MALAEITYAVPDPVVTTYAIPFLFLRDNHITVTVNGVAAGVVFAITSTKDELTISAPPLNIGDLVKIQRATPITTAGQLVTFNDPASLRRDDLQVANRQLLYGVQEIADRNSSGMRLDITDSKWNAEGRNIKNVADPVAAQDATTKAWVETTFALGGVLPVPAGLPDAHKALRVDAAGTGYTLGLLAQEQYHFRTIQQGAPFVPFGRSFGWVAPGGEISWTADEQRVPLELVRAYNDAGHMSVGTGGVSITLGSGAWIIEAAVHLRGLTDTAFTNGSGASLAITNADGSVVYAESPRFTTGTSFQVSDSTWRTLGLSTSGHLVFYASLPITTTICLRARASLTSHSVVVDWPSHLTIRRVTR